MKHKKTPSRNMRLLLNVLLISLAYSVYVLFFFGFYKKLEMMTNAFIIVPMVISNILLGFRRGMILSIISAVLNNILLYYTGAPLWQTANIAGPLLVIFMSGSVGLLHDQKKQLENKHEELRLVKEKLAESEQQFRTIYETISSGILITNTHHNKLYMGNRAMLEMLGYSLEELRKLTVFKIHPEEEHKAILDRHENHINEPFLQESVPVIRKDGSIFYADIVSGPIVLRKKTFLLSFFRDVTLRKQAEEALRHSEEKFRALVEVTSDWVWAVDANGTYVYSSPKIKDLLGYEPEDVIGKSPFDFMPPEEKERISALFQRIVEAGESFTELENINIHKDGHHVVLETNGVPVFDAENNLIGYRGIDRDITRRRRAEKALQHAYGKLKSAQHQLVQAEKMQTVCRLAGGVAHEVKNPLGIIIQGVAVLKKRLHPQDADINKVLNYIQESVRRADNIIKGLLDFSSLSHLNLEDTDLNSVVERSLSLMNPLIDSQSVQVIKELNNNMPFVQVDRSRIEQVLVNLSLNAINAMPEGGKLKVRTSLNKIQEFTGSEVLEKWQELQPEKTMAVIQIEDTGIGIPEENMDKIWEPFFTTRENRGGTGLGLAIVKNIMDVHQGKVEIENRSSGGVSTTVMFQV
ncbi:PAS domain S-box protein [Candidatus Margulisiibacteriota bacterium]